MQVVLNVSGRQIRRALTHSIATARASLKFAASGQGNPAPASSAAFIHVGSSLLFEYHIARGGNLVVSKISIRRTATAAVTPTATATATTTATAPSGSDAAVAHMHGSKPATTANASGVTKASTQANMPMNSTTGSTAVAVAHWITMGDDEVFSVATTGLLGGGGAGYTMFSDTPVQKTGRTVFSAVESYLIAHTAHTSATSPADIRALVSAPRTVQLPTRRVIQLGHMCSTLVGPTGEKCQHVISAVHAINHKHDGFFDTLLPNVQLELHTAVSGCSGPTALLTRAMWEADSTLPNMVGIVGPRCSSDVKAASEWMSANNKSFAIISPASTAPQLADEILYPNIARLAASEKVITKGAQQLMNKYGWRRIGILADESVWATGTIAAFIKHLKDNIPGVEITNEDDMTFAHGKIVNKTLDPQTLLKRLDALNTKIVFIATQPYIQREIFETVYQKKLLYGKGFAWINAWPSDNAFYNNDSSVNEDAVKGAQGSIAFIEGVYESNATRNYVKQWADNSNSKDACDLATPFNQAGPYCDADGDPTSFPDRGANGVDCVLAFAMVIEKLTDQGHAINASSIYQGLLAMGSFDGTSGSVTLDQSSGDRISGLEIQNLMVEMKELPVDANIAYTARARRGVKLNAVVARYKYVGDFDPRITPSVIELFTNITFPGLTHTPPDDGTVTPSNSDDGGSSAYLFAVFGALFFVYVACKVAWNVHLRRAKNTPHDFGVTDLDAMIDAGGFSRSVSTEVQEMEEFIITKPNEIRRMNVKLVEVLGRGNFGEVWKAKLTGSAGSLETVAAKVINPCEDSDSVAARQSLFREAMVTAQLSGGGGHENVVALVGVVTAGTPAIMLVSYCLHGSLLDQLRDRAARQDAFSHALKLKLCTQICKGMEHLVAHHIVHRDLAARNILLDDNWSAKIADFGLSRELHLQTNTNTAHISRGAAYYRSTDVMLALRWSAPECMETMVFTTASDVWSFGIVVVELFQDGERPYKSLPDNDNIRYFLQKGERIPRSEIGCSVAMYRLLLWCWDKEPSLRPGFADTRSAFTRLISAIDAPTTTLPTLSLADKQDVCRWLHAGAPSGHYILDVSKERRARFHQVIYHQLVEEFPQFKISKGSVGEDADRELFIKATLVDAPDGTDAALTGGVHAYGHGHSANHGVVRPGPTPKNAYSIVSQGPLHTAPIHRAFSSSVDGYGACGGACLPWR